MMALKVQKRLMPGVVVRAYVRKGIKASVGSYRRETSYGICGCAMSVRFCTKRELVNLNDSNHIGRLAKSRAVRYGLTWDYVNAFIKGFDNNLDITKDEEDAQGYADGKKTRALVEKHGLVRYNMGEISP